MQGTTSDRPAIDRRRAPMAVQAHGLHRVSREAVENGANCTDFISPPYVGVEPCASLYMPMPYAATDSRRFNSANSFVDQRLPTPPRAVSRKRVRAEEQFSAATENHKRGRPLQQIHPAVLLQHLGKMGAELQRQRHYTAQVVTAAATLLAAKDEETRRARALNLSLEERLRSLCAEARAWRGVALSQEAAAAALRADLDRALQSHQLARAADDPGDAASCCYGDNGDDAAGEAGDAGRCRACGGQPSAVLVLPCRHLWACAACTAAAPACGCAKRGVVHVNLVSD